MNTNTFTERVARYDTNIARHQADEAAVKTILAADPIDPEKLRPYAAQQFDSWCGADGGQCGCCYCTARRALKALGG